VKILTVGDSWTYGEESSDPETMSWPAQMASKYNVEVTNLATSGCSNKRAMRVCVEEILVNPIYDFVIFPLCPASRTEILNQGKWMQIWSTERDNDFNKLFASVWHSFNDVQQIILDCFMLFNTLENLRVNLYVTGLAFRPNDYRSELSWITKYAGDNKFDEIGIPTEDFDLATEDMHQKLTFLQYLHNGNLFMQPDYLNDVCANYLNQPGTKKIYGDELYASGRHPNDQGYTALADYFANKIGLC
jgi:hypothetical protein